MQGETAQWGHQPITPPLWPHTQQQAAYGQYPQSRTSGFAIASLVVGILGALLFWTPFAYLLSPLAIIFGGIGISQTKQNNLAGRGMAIAGLVLGIITLFVVLAFLLLFGFLSLLLGF